MVETPVLRRLMHVPYNFACFLAALNLVVGYHNEVTQLCYKWTNMGRKVNEVRLAPHDGYKVQAISDNNHLHITLNDI